MKQLRRDLAALAITTTFLLSASAPALPQTAKPEPKGGYTIGFVTPLVTNPFYVTMRCGAEESAKKLNVNLVWQGTTQSFSPRDVSLVMQAVVAQKPDGFIMVPWDATAFITPLRDLMASGTPVITADGKLAEPVDVQNIRTDGHAAGAAAARELLKQNTAKGSVLILTATPGDAVQNDRWQGFKEVLDSGDGSLRALNVQYIGTDSTKAASITTSTLVAHPDLAVVYMTQGVGAEGVANALRAAGRKDKIRVIIWDSLPNEVEFLKAGDVDELVSQSPYDMGYKMIVSMVEVLRQGREKANLAPVVFTGVKTLTRENIDDPDSKPFKYRPSCQ